MLTRRELLQVQRDQVDLHVRIRSEAAVATRADQAARLGSIADDVAALLDENDKLQAALDRVREIEAEWGSHAPKYSMHVGLAANRLRAALEGESSVTDA